MDFNKYIFFLHSNGFDKSVFILVIPITVHMCMLYVKVHVFLKKDYTKDSIPPIRWVVKKGETFK